MATITLRVQPAPSTPLNLKVGVLYAPRVPTPPFVAYDVVEVAPNGYHVRLYVDDDLVTIKSCDGTAAAWLLLAQCLRMDVPA